MNKWGNTNKGPRGLIDVALRLNAWESVSLSLPFLHGESKETNTWLLFDQQAALQRYDKRVSLKYQGQGTLRLVESTCSLSTTSLLGRPIEP